MDPLKPSSPLSAALRSLRLARTDAATGQRVPEQASSERADAPASLRDRILELVAGVDATDPDAVRRARKPVINAILLNEFGESAKADPRFDEMVAAVEAALVPRADGTDPFVEMLRALGKK
jgi:hypothetical protein